MITFNGTSSGITCDGQSRRNFLQVGSLGIAGLTLPNLLRAKEAGAALNNKSVIWVWLGGGPTHVETFDPKMDAPSEYRSTTGECKTTIPGVSIGGTYPKLAQQMKNMAIVRSFAHGNSSHGSGTTWVMTGYNDRTKMRPSMGSIIAKAKGTAHPVTGLPSFVRIGGIGSDGPGWLGTRYQALSPSGQARKNMELAVDASRFESRHALLDSIDVINRKVDRTGQMEGLDGFEQQAFELVLGSAKDAFDIKKEDPKVRARYGKGLGEQLLLARRLTAAGSRFVNIQYGGWDMHGKIQNAMKSRSPQMDQGLSALIEDLKGSGQLDNTLLVVTGEFGRTPRVNKNAGRDHWGRLCTLMLAGGGLNMGQVIGKSSPKLEDPAERHITPQDMLATVIQMFGLDPKLQFLNHQGRPTYVVENGRPIKELF
ncbi:MAG: DUF1501 domain-containing protein [Verrucomicrobia subdivision 3 bacterium]|nr:DUF1501 domain-containing protein [Limisphaerales bacterium]